MHATSAKNTYNHQEQLKMVFTHGCKETDKEFTQAQKNDASLNRLIKHDIVTGNDLCIVLFPGDYKYAERNEQINSLMRKANLFQ